MSASFCSFGSSSATAESDREAGPAARFWAGDASGEAPVLIDAGLEAAGTTKGAVLRAGDDAPVPLWGGWAAVLAPALAALGTAAAAED